MSTPTVHAQSDDVSVAAELCAIVYRRTIGGSFRAALHVRPRVLATRAHCGTDLVGATRPTLATAMQTPACPRCLSFVRAATRTGEPQARTSDGHADARVIAAQLLGWVAQKQAARARDPLPATAVAVGTLTRKGGDVSNGNERGDRAGDGG